MEALGLVLTVISVALLILALSLKQVRGGVKAGIILISLGLLIWLGNMDLLPYINWKRDWPWILILIGLWLVVKYFVKILSRKGNSIAKKNEKIKKVLDDLESGKISAEEAIKKIREEK